LLAVAQALLHEACWAGLVRSPRASVWFISPREFDVLHGRQERSAPTYWCSACVRPAPCADPDEHTSDVQATFRLEDAPEHGTSAVLFVNGTEALRTSTTQSSVLLSGLTPGVCELTVQVLHGGEVIASSETLFLISSAALDPRGLGSPSSPDPSGEWTAVAFGSDDWGRSADMIPIFPHQAELDRTEREGWDPGA